MVNVKTAKLFFGIFLMMAVNKAFAAEDLESLLTDPQLETPKVEIKKNQSAPSPAIITKQKFTPLSLALYDLLEKTTSEQNIFIRYLEEQKWTEALLQFSNAFEGTPFQKTENGKALLSYLQFSSGLKITGIESLMKVSQVKNIHPEIRKIWVSALEKNEEVWRFARVEWNEGWTAFLGNKPALSILMREIYESDQDENPIPKLTELRKRTPEKSDLQELVDWKLITAYSIKDQTDIAGKILSTFLKKEKTGIDKDLLNLTAGRLLYQNGYFDAAVKLYEKISQNSDYWVEAHEEISWAYIRKGQPQNALAKSKDLMTPQMSAIINPESFLVHSLSQLKICDYSGVMASLNLFSKQFKQRTIDLNKLSETPDPKDLQSLMSVLSDRNLKRADLGQLKQRYPQLLHRDSSIRFLVMQKNHLEEEAKMAEKIYGNSLALTGLQGSFEALKNSIQQRSQSAQALVLQRIKSLAKEEVTETQEVLKKLHIIEAEVLQQSLVAQKISKAADINLSKKGTTGAPEADALKFPLDGEIWFDEINSLKVDIKKPCVAKGGSNDNNQKTQ